MPAHRAGRRHRSESHDGEFDLDDGGHDERPYAKSVNEFSDFARRRERR